MNILVTGGSGFIGSHLVESLLNHGHFVTNIDNFDDFYSYRIKIQNTLESIGLPLNFEFDGKEKDIKHLQGLVNRENYELFYQDIRNKEGLKEVFASKKFDVIVHLAALAGVRSSIERPLDYQSVNIEGTMNLWELCREFGISKMVIASSSSVYGNNEKIPFSEDDNVDKPISPYAATKRSVEILGHVYHHLYQMDMVHLRFFTVYGPRQRPDLAIHKFSNLIYNNQNVPFYGDGSTKRDYTYIDDIIQGVVGAINYVMEHENVYEIINLGENHVTSLSEMLISIENSLGKKAVKMNLPKQQGDVDRTYADVAKAKALIGYRPSVEYQNGIKKFMEWFLKKSRK